MSRINRVLKKDKNPLDSQVRFSYRHVSKKIPNQFCITLRKMDLT